MAKTVKPQSVGSLMQTKKDFSKNFSKTGKQGMKPQKAIGIIPNRRTVNK